MELDHSAITPTTIETTTITTTTTTTPWQKRISELELYKSTHGHLNVPSSDNGNDDDNTYRELAQWIIRIRSRYRLGKLPRRKIQQLTNMGFSWDNNNNNNNKRRRCRRRRWNDRYEELKSYKSLHGDCNVPISYSKYPLLGGWVRRQRHFYRQRQRQPTTTGRGDDATVVSCPLTDERIELLNQLDFEWSSLSSSSSCPNVTNWDRRYNQLRRFKIKHGHCRIPKDHHQIALLNWVNRQRRQYHRMNKQQQRRREDGINDDDTKRNQLTEEQIARLDSLGFQWDGNNNKPSSSLTREGPSWRQRYEELKIYKQQNGDCMVPKHYGPNKKLGNWVSTQRDMLVRMKDGKKGSTMTEERRRLLDELGFTWRAHGSSQTQSRWSTRIQQLLQFHTQHGHYLIPKHYPPNPSLGKWVSRQRQNYALLQQGKPTNMTPERCRQLSEMGFNFNMTKNEQEARERWNTRLGELKAFKEEHGHCLVPGIYGANPSLGKWVANQRRQYKKRQRGEEGCTLTQERCEELESLGFVWTVVTTDVVIVDDNNHTGDVVATGEKTKKNIFNKSSAWGKRLIQLVDYKKTHGNVDVPRNYHVKGLGAWVNRQRCDYRTFRQQQQQQVDGKMMMKKKCGMTEERVRLLDQLGFVWDKRRRQKESKIGSEGRMVGVVMEEGETITDQAAVPVVREMTTEGLMESDCRQEKGRINDDNGDSDGCFPSMMDVQKALD